MTVSKLAIFAALGAHPRIHCESHAKGGDRMKALECLPVRPLRAAYFVAATLALGINTPVAVADTIDEMVHNTGALESPFWKYLYNNGYGYLDAKRVGDDGNVACANRKAGVPPSQVIPLLQSRGYTASEAKGIVLAEQAASESQAFPVC